MGWFIRRLAFCAVAVALSGCDCGGGAEREGSLSLVSLSPESGPLAGGTVVELRGTGFGDGLQVIFGALTADGVEVVGSTLARAVTPPAEFPGPVDVTVSRGAYEDSLPEAFEYISGPRIDSVEPSRGSVEGGTLVVVTGVGFAEGATLSFGGSPAMDVVRVDAETLTAATPAGLPGLVDVAAENPDGQSDVLEEGFEYIVPLPCRLMGSTPSSGEGGIAVTASVLLEWNEPIAVDSLAAEVALREPGGEEVAASVQAEGDGTVRVTPSGSLHFWSAYVISVGSGITTTQGEACEGAALAFATVRPEPAARGLHPAGVSGLVVVDGYALVASDDYRGLQVFDVRDPGQASLIGEVITRHSPVNLVAKDDRAYAPAGYSGTMIFDISDRSSPTLVGHAGSPGNATDAAPFEGEDGQLLLAVADGIEGVRLLDVTDPEGVRDLGAVDPSGVRDADVRAVDIAGSLLAIADGKYGVEVASLDDLGDPVILGRADIGRDALDVVIRGQMLYAAYGLNGGRAFDLTDPSALDLLGTVYGPSGECQYDCTDFFYSLSAASDELLVASVSAGLLRVAIDGIGGMDLTAALVTPGHRTMRAVATADQLFAGDESGLVLYAADAVDGAEPAWFDPEGHGLARFLDVEGQHVYVAASSRGLKTYSIDDANAPALVDRDDSPGSLSGDYGAFAVEAAPGVVVLGDGRVGMTIYDATDPSNPVEVAQLAAHDRVGAMAFRGTTLFACDDNWGMLVTDLSSPATPELIAEVRYESLDSQMPADQCYDLVAHDGYLYMASLQVLSVIDISDTSAPFVVGRFPLRAGDAVLRLDVTGDYLVATTSVADFEALSGSTHRVQVFDISDPARPTRIWVSEDLGSASDVSVAGDVAFVTAGELGVYVFDVADPTAPLLEGIIATPGNGLGIVATEEAVYVAAQEGGLLVLVTGPLPPSR